MDAGSVFELSRPSVPGGAWTETILYSFTGGSDGSTFYGGVVFDAHGNLDGAAWVGGNFGGGTIYQLTPPATAGGTWSENTLYQFTYYGPDGGAPVAKPILDRKGNIFGTASAGNGGPNAFCGPTCGSVYELSPPSAGASSWKETTIYSFVGVQRDTVRRGIPEPPAFCWESTGCSTAPPWRAEILLAMGWSSKSSLD